MLGEAVFLKNLRVCPFCGNTVICVPEDHWTESKNRKWVIECHYSQLHSPFTFGHFKTAKEATEAWNTTFDLLRG